jgi:hypothetical protein
VTLNPHERYPSVHHLTRAAEPTAAETESRNVARLLQYAMGVLDQSVPDWVSFAAQSERGDLSVHETICSLLSDLCLNLTPDERRFVLGNGRNPNARALSQWWTDRQSGQAVS